MKNSVKNPIKILKKWKEEIKVNGTFTMLADYCWILKRNPQRVCKWKFFKRSFDGI